MPQLPSSHMISFRQPKSYNPFKKQRTEVEDDDEEEFFRVPDLG